MDAVDAGMTCALKYESSWLVLRHGMSFVASHSTMKGHLPSFTHTLFHGQWPVKPDPERYREDYSTEEQAAFLAEHRRRCLFRRRHLSPAILLSILGVVVAFVWAESRWVPWTAICLAFVWIVVVIAWGDFTHCPACESGLGTEMGLYCPHCGVKDLEVESKQLFCPNCQTHLEWCRSETMGLGCWTRSKVHSCSVCGILVSESGL